MTMDYRFYLSLVLRRLPLMLVITLLGAGVGVSLAVLLPPTYQAEARLVIESEQMPDELAASTVRVDASEQLQIIEQRILTRDNLIDLANEYDVYAPPPGQAAPQMSADDIVDDLRDRIRIRTLDQEGSGSGGEQVTLFAVSFEASSAELAARVANQVVTLILEANVEMRTRTAGQTLDFFIQEVERLDSELAATSEAIQAFQSANQDALPDSLEFRRGQLLAEQERLLELQRDETALQDRRERLVELFENTGRVNLVDDEPRTEEERELQSLQNELASALAVLSPTNPRIAILRNQIAALESQVAASGARSDIEGEPLSPYEIELADLDSQLEALAEQRADVETRLAELQETISATPTNALKLDELQRDFESIRAQYDSAVERRAVAETGEMIEILSRGQRISVIEQAVPPEDPVSPNRRFIAAGGLAGGLALSLGAFVLLEVANRAVRRPADLMSGLGITPFGVIPLLRDRRDVLRRRLRITAALMTVLLLIPAGLWLLHSRVVPLNLLADRVVESLNDVLQAAQDSLG